MRTTVEKLTNATWLPRKPRLAKYPGMEYVSGKVGEHQKTAALGRGLEEFLGPLKPAKAASPKRRKRAR